MPHQTWRGRKLHNKVCNRLQGASWKLFKSLCSKVSVGSRKVRLFHPGLSPHIDPLVIYQGLLADSAPRTVPPSAPASIREFWSYGWAWECQPIPSLGSPILSQNQIPGGPPPCCPVSSWIALILLREPLGGRLQPCMAMRCLSTQLLHLPCS